MSTTSLLPEAVLEQNIRVKVGTVTVEQPEPVTVQIPARAHENPSMGIRRTDPAATSNGAGFLVAALSVLVGILAGAVLYENRDTISGWFFTVPTNNGGAAINNRLPLAVNTPAAQVALPRPVIDFKEPDTKAPRGYRWMAGEVGDPGCKEVTFQGKRGTQCPNKLVID